MQHGPIVKTSPTASPTGDAIVAMSNNLRAIIPDAIGGSNHQMFIQKGCFEDKMMRFLTAIEQTSIISIPWNYKSICPI